MISKENKSVQITMNRKVVESLEQLCNTFSEKLGVRVTKGMLITFMFNKFLDTLLDEVNQIQNDEEHKEVD